MAERERDEATQRSRASVLLLPGIYLGFVSLGLPDGTLGVAWPRMYEALDSPIGFAGVLALAITLLSALSGFSSGAVVRRLTTGPMVAVSCALTGSGMLLIAHAPSLPWLLLAALPLGLGAGAVDAGLNGYVARHYSGRHMNWLHACWGLGATVGPLVMAQALDTGPGWRGGYSALATVQLVLAALFLVPLRLWGSVPERSATPHRLAETAPGLSAGSTAGWLSAAIFALYVGVETTTGLWASSILVVSRGVAPQTAGMCAAAYYGSITAGRVLVGFVVDRWGNRPLVAFGTALAFAGALLFALAPSTAVAAAGLVLLGLGFSPVYPCLMHEVPRRFAPDAVPVVIGRQSGASYLGAAFLPAAAGWLGQLSLESVAWAVAAGVSLVVVAVRRLDRMT